MANTVSYIYEILDRYSGPLRKISNQTNRFTRIAGRAQKSIGNMGRKMEAFSTRASTMQGALGALGLTAALKGVVSVSSDMEDAMGDISRVTGLTGKPLLKFEDMLERISEELGKSKRGLAEMAFEGGKLGILPENMEKFLLMTARTAIAFDMVDQESGRAIGSIRAKMGLMDDDIGRLLDSTNFLADNTSASGARMIEVIERLSGTFSILELPPEVAAAFAGFADQVEVTPQLAASGMRMMIRQMRKFPGMTTKLMEDPVGAVNEQLEKMAKMGPELQTRFIQKVFGPEAGRFVEKAVSKIALFQETTEKALSPEAVGSMQRELEEQLRRSSKHFQRFGVVAKNTIDTIGDVLKPFFVELAKFSTTALLGIRAFVKENPNLVKFAGGIMAITAAVGVLIVGAGLLAGVLAPILTGIAAMSAPVALAVAGVASLGYVFAEWYQTANPVLDVLGGMYDEIILILTPFGQMLGLVGEGVGGFDLLGGAIEHIGLMIAVLLTPLKMFLQAIRGVVQASVALGRGDMTGAINALSASGTDIIKSGAEGLTNLGRTIGIDNSKDVANRRAGGVQGLNATGEITVSAIGGARVEKSNIRLNGGQNVATGGGGGF